MIGPPMCRRCFMAADSIMASDLLGWIAVVISDVYTGTLIEQLYLCPDCRIPLYETWL